MALVMVALMVGLTAVLSPFAANDGPPLLTVLSAYDAVVIVADATTAAILLIHFLRLKWLSLLILTCGYAFTSMTAFLHIMSFPGLLAPQGVFGGPQTGSLFWMLLHGAFPLFAVASTLLQRTGRPLVSPGALRWAAVMTITLIAACVWAATHSPDLSIVNDNAFSRLGLIWLGVATILAVSVVILAFRARSSLLNLWLSVGVVALGLDFVNVWLAGKRFALGWYVGPAYGIVASAVVLIAYISEVSILLHSHSVSAELRELNEKLKERTAELSHEMSVRRQAQAEADRANLAKSKFLAAASHDLRQPVQALSLFLDVLKAQASAPLVTRVVGAMGDALEGLNGLLSSILDISRIDAGVVAPQMQSIDIGGLIDRLGGEYAPLFGQKDLRLRCRSKPGLYTRTDPVLLERILRNLIDNAVRYTERGGLIIGVRRRGERVRIDLVDTGIGIPTDKLEHIFEEFYQIANPARDHKQGLGLGLSIVRRLARLIGAEVEVRSREGRGTRFTVLVPVGAMSEQKSSPSAAPEVVSGLRIMVIEDEPTIRMGLRLVLEGWNCEVLSAGSGEEALAIGEQDRWRFDAIIADHRLGAGMSGTQTAAELGRRSGRRIPILIVTGDTAPERIEEIHASGFEVMHKPVSPKELARRMAHLLPSRNFGKHSVDP
jgi:signal transduction histidine kinase